MAAPHLHHHHPRRPSPLTRRSFLRDLGRTSLGLVLVSPVIAACSGGGTNDSADADSPSTSPSSATAGSGDDTVETTAPDGEGAGEAAVDRLRVDFGFVAAYIVARAGQAAVIDTGVVDSEGEILTMLEQIGLGWDAVGDVVLTHFHGDHAGSLPAIADLAGSASLWAGADDISNLDAPRTITAVGDGDQVFGMDIINTPGHTPGHISVLDGGVLFSGDALVGADGRLAGPNPEFTADMATAVDSVVKLGGYDFDAVNVSHGFPTEGGSDAVQALGLELQSSGG